MFKKQGICCFDVSSFALAPSVFGGAERVCDDVGDGALREGRHLRIRTTSRGGDPPSALGSPAQRGGS